LSNVWRRIWGDRVYCRFPIHSARRSYCARSTSCRIARLQPPSVYRQAP
jgi:hypothetical protein